MCVSCAWDMCECVCSSGWVGPMRAKADRKKKSCQLSSLPALLSKPSTQGEAPDHLSVSSASGSSHLLPPALTTPAPNPCGPQGRLPSRRPRWDTKFSSLPASPSPCPRLPPGQDESLPFLSPASLPANPLLTTHVERLTGGVIPSRKFHQQPPSNANSTSGVSGLGRGDPAVQPPVAARLVPLSTPALAPH